MARFVLNVRPAPPFRSDHPDLQGSARTKQAQSTRIPRLCAAPQTVTCRPQPQSVPWRRQCLCTKWHIVHHIPAILAACIHQLLLIDSIPSPAISSYSSQARDGQLLRHPKERQLRRRRSNTWRTTRERAFQIRQCKSSGAKDKRTARWQDTWEQSAGAWGVARPQGSGGESSRGA